MSSEDYHETECKRFLGQFETWDDPTWAFYVYGTFERPADDDSQAMDRRQPVRSRYTTSTEDTDLALADDAPLKVALSKLRAHADDTLRHHKPPPYNQKLIDTLRLEPAGYFPGASLADVCTHFRENHAYIIDREREYQPEYERELQDTQGWKCGPKYDWCLVIDGDSLKSIESAPEPHGPSPSEDANPEDLGWDSVDAWVILLTKEYTTMTPPVLRAAGRRGQGTTKWPGWLKFSPTMLFNVFRQTNSGGGIENFYKGPDELVEF
jgi:hypothetical protein